MSRGLACALLVALVAAGPAAAGPLERHRPVLVYDSDEHDFARSVGGLARRVVYGHEVRGGGRTWLQYWLYFAYNSQDRGILHTGRHEGDWELLQLRLNQSNRPDLATLAAHTWAAGCRWSELRWEGDAPVVFVANGSHALYPRPGTWDRPFPDPNDEADGAGRRVRPFVEPITDGSPAWVERRERWGDSRAGWVPGEQSSPPGPKFQDGGAWRDPAGFHADQARGCLEGPPGRWWMTVLLSVLGIMAVAVTVFLGRRFILSLR